MRTCDFLDALMSRHGLRSNYAIAKFMGWSTSTVYNYRAGRSHLSDQHAVEVAEKLGIDPLQVMASVAAERSKCPAVREQWERLSRLVGSVLMAAVVGLSGLAGSSPAAASDGVTVINHGTHYAQSRRRQRPRRRWRFFRFWRSDRLRRFSRSLTANGRPTPNHNPQVMA